MKTLIPPPAGSPPSSRMDAVPDEAKETVAGKYSAPRNRRQLVRTAPNPDPGSDYLVRFEIETTPSFALGPLRFVTRYVPDKLLLEPSCLGDYFHALTQPEWPTLEAMALAMRDDLGNEVIPRWIEIVVSPSRASLETARHSVLVEERQPQWDNPSLLARLGDC